MNVLLVDDAAAVRRRIAILCRDAAGVRDVTEASSLTEARRILALWPPDVVVLDLNLRGESGLELLGELKRAHPSTKVIVLTNHDSAQHRRSCAELGADYFLDKSGEFEALAPILERLAGVS